MKQNSTTYIDFTTEYNDVSTIVDSRYLDLAYLE